MRLILVILTTLLFSCKTQEQTTTTMNESNAPIEFTELNAGNNGDFSEKKQVIISSQADLNKLWEAAFANYMQKETAPTLDFNTKTVLLVAYGQSNDGGAQIKIDHIIETNETIEVSIIETKAGKGCVVTESITFPYQIVAIAKPLKPITFKSTLKVIDCD